MYMYIYVCIYIYVYIIYIYICIELRKFSVMTTMQLPSLLCFSVGAARLGRLFISILMGPAVVICRTDYLQCHTNNPLCLERSVGIGAWDAWDFCFGGAEEKIYPHQQTTDVKTGRPIFEVPWG